MKPLGYLFVFLALSLIGKNAIAQRTGRAKVDSLKTVLKLLDQQIVSFKNDTSKVNVLVSLGYEYYYIYPDSSVFFGSQALNLAKKVNYLKGEANADHILGIAYWAKDENKISLDYHFKSLKLRQVTGNKPGITASYINLGNSYSSMGDYGKALEYYDKALKLEEELMDRAGIAHSYHSIALTLEAMGRDEESLVYQLKSIKIREELNDRPGLAYSYNALGNFYSKRKNREKAIEYYNKCLSVKKELDDKLGIADTYTNIANQFALQGKTNDALRLHSMSLASYEEIGIPAKIALGFLHVGNDLVDKKNYFDALDHFSRSIKIFESLGDLHGMALNLGPMSEANLKLGRIGESVQLGKRHLSISKDLNSKIDMMEALEGLSQCDSALGNWRDAYDYYKLSSAVKDSLNEKEHSEKVSEILSKYEADKKEKEIVLLQKDKELQNGEIEKQKLLRNSIGAGAGVIALSSLFSFFFYKRKRDAEQKQKETSLSLQVSETEMKALRSQMNPHFIFNALQSIQTFLMSHKSEEANIYLLKFSKLMRLVLENSQHSEVPLKNDMQALQLYMQLESIRLRHPFTYEFHIDESIDEENDTIPPLILQPFVENAIWHGLQYKPQPGHINIYISKKDNALYATVEDNGVGRDMSKKVRQPMLIKKESLGMKLTEERLKILNELKKIKAQFKITDLFTKENTPAGTRVELSLPVV